MNMSDKTKELTLKRSSIKTELTKQVGLPIARATLSQPHGIHIFNLTEHQHQWVSEIIYLPLGGPQTDDRFTNLYSYHGSYQHVFTALLAAIERMLFTPVVLLKEEKDIFRVRDWEAVNKLQEQISKAVSAGWTAPFDMTQGTLNLSELQQIKIPKKIS